MTAPPPKRPFWKRKRWIAAVALWLVMMYPVSLGPTFYAVGRGWLPDWAAMIPYQPLILFDGTYVLAMANKYAEWFYVRGQEHAASP